jgi:hypothetical protein
MSAPHDSSAATAAHAGRHAVCENTCAAGEIPRPPSPTPGQGEENYDFDGAAHLPVYYEDLPAGVVLKHKIPLGAV